MKTLSKAQITSSLESCGFSFSESTIIHEGIYAPEDVCWNYKDMPHLNHVHSQVECIDPIIGDKVMARLVNQNLFGMNLPLTVVSYNRDNTSHTYFTNFLFYTLITETTWKEIEHNRTKVTTVYSVGAKSIFTLAFPIIHWILKRNFKILMEADIPMRLRKGELRSWGYKFLGGDPTYSFEKTLDLSRDNVVVPSNGEPTKYGKIDIAKVLPGNGEYMLGRDDHLGLRIVRNSNDLMIYQRMCLHEGASLDYKNYINGGSGIPPAPCKKKDNVLCSWHGKSFPPLSTFDLSYTQTQQKDTKFLSFKMENGILTIEPNKK